MPIRPTSHFDWQVLRTVKRSKKPPVGRTLRLVPNRKTKDGSFLTDLVEEGLLERATGTEADPFEATYTLTEKGKFAAEYGEYEYQVKPRVAEPAPAPKERKSR
ncbi:hypothetical protein VT84_07905 [Gemmata sp. SH-PL17]|uniref:HTH hxlR-type domain-containing protein n=1 Tax=Gemmata massiliana TaxID=1210884 RepID=A0A6P2CXD8_9BACT|nr:MULTISPECIES: MarR family transcriptional regulator [Gemmata]AMV24305.1 hypothetical protein VT84_07905 [Gemmata sp. SH-PL17]VTR92414.1 unnamed protein product [Gemmata massiliana]